MTEEVIDCDPDGDNEPFDPAYCDLQISSQIPMTVSDAYDVLQKFEIEISYDEEPVGKCSIHVAVPLIANLNQVSFFDMWDAESDSCARVAKAITENEDEIEELTSIVLYEVNRIWYVDSIEIKEPFRGHRLGLMTLKRFFQQHLESNQLVILEPGELSGATPEGRAWLTKYWSELGFVVLPGTYYMVGSNRTMSEHLFPFSEEDF